PQTTSPFNGGDLYVRDSHTAANIFVERLFRNAPKTKFSYYVVFNINSAVADKRLDVRNLIYLVKTFDPPKADFSLETLNQYNKKRVIQKTVSYDPVTIRFHDDIDNNITQFTNDYFAYYYGDVKNMDMTLWKANDIVSTFREAN